MTSKCFALINWSICRFVASSVFSSAVAPNAIHILITYACVSLPARRILFASIISASLKCARVPLVQTMMRLPHHCCRVDERKKEKSIETIDDGNKEKPAKIKWLEFAQVMALHYMALRHTSLRCLAAESDYCRSNCEYSTAVMIIEMAGRPYKCIVVHRRHFTSCEFVPFAVK